MANENEKPEFLLFEANQCRLRAAHVSDENLKKRWLELAREYEARAEALLADRGDPNQSTRA